MSTKEVLVAIHGYDPEGMEGGRDPEPVWRDRLSKGLEIVERLESLSLKIDVAISGNGNYDGKSEAQLIKEFAEEEFESLTENYDIITEEQSKDTEENVVQLHRIGKQLEVDFIFPISSKDHAPRIQRDWENHIEPVDNFTLAAIGSEEAYASSGKMPFIIEAAMYEPFVEPFNKVLDINPKNYEEAAEEVRKVLEKYR